MPIAKLLVANRGEIALRVFRACRELGIATVAVAAPDDRGSLHARTAEETVEIASYLDPAEHVRAATASGADAVHPGYGFLAENATFAEAVESAGLAWVGPPPSALRAGGDKLAARRIAQEAGVPVLPEGTPEELGYPLLVKAAAGGGGRGMRVVQTAADLDDALAAARREALAGFDDDRLLLERYISRPRHVEMQVFGDEHGRVLYLGERDCSIQRRHQKVIEEAPAPRFSEQQRHAMGEAAIALARAAGYTNAGTVEFLSDEEGRFYFLEMNTRLQVEHPVTELVTGLDLVDLQLRVAAGDRLPLDQSDVQVKGHAIECRLYAEDPTSGFLPSTGRLTEFDVPDEEDESVRVDTGFIVGDEVSPFYDPLLAKIIVHAEDRLGAIREMEIALTGVAVEGVRTNLEFLEDIIASPAFREGDVHTRFIEEHGLPRPPRSIPEEVLLAAAVAEVRWDKADYHQRGGERSRTVAGDPWRAAGPWRVGWIGARVCYRHAQGAVVVGVCPPVPPDSVWRFELDGQAVERRVRVGPHGQIVFEGEGATQRLVVQRSGAAQRHVAWGNQSFRVQLVSGSVTGGDQRGAELRTTHDVILAPMPGRIVKLLARPGDHVTANQTLLVLEAMKIEHLVTAPRDGVVESVRYNEGDQVELGAALIELED